MLQLTSIINLLIAHWVGDYICQTNWMAANKGKLNTALILHTFIYATIIGIGVCLTDGYAPLLKGFDYVDKIIFVTFIIHTLQDYFTSRLNIELRARRWNHLLAISMGMDQLLHGIQVMVTYNIFH